MKISNTQWLKQCAARWCLLGVMVGSWSNAAYGGFIMSFPDIQVVPGAFTAPVIVSSSSTNVTSINPSIEVSLLSGSGSILMTAYTPLNGVAPVGTIWSGETVSTGVSSPPSLPSAIAKFNFSVPSPVLASGDVMLLTFDATNAAVGSVFQVELNFNNLTTAADLSGPLPPSEKSFLAGTISVVPEPAAWLFMAVSVVSGIVGRRLMALIAGKSTTIVVDNVA